MLLIWPEYLAVRMRISPSKAQRRDAKRTQHSGT
jgi:hypothetical protein